MATYDLPIITANFIPDSTGRTFIQPYTILAGTNMWGQLTCVLTDPASAQQHGFYGQFTVPQNYISTPVLVTRWTAGATAGNVLNVVNYRVVAVGSSMTGTTQDTVSATTAAPGSTNLLLETTMSLSGPAFTANAEVEYYISRADLPSGTDTMAASQSVFTLIFRYADA